MYNIKRVGLGILLFPLIILLSGCVTLSNFNGPETLKPGKWVYGTGISTALAENDDYMIPSYELYTRFGVAENFDVGLKVAGLFSVVGGDLKYRFFNSEKFMASLDMGFSYASLEDEDSALIDETCSVYGFYPALILGNEKLYFGPKLVYLIGKGGFDDFIKDDDRLPSKKWIPGFFAGYKIKLFKWFSVIPEITMYYTPDHGIWFYGGVAIEL